MSDTYNTDSPSSRPQARRLPPLDTASVLPATDEMVDMARPEAYTTTTRKLVARIDRDRDLLRRCLVAIRDESPSYISLIQDLEEAIEEPPKMKRGKNDKETCALNGWKVGDVLEGTEGDKTDRITIHYIGPVMLICHWERHGMELSTDLGFREWRKVN